VSPTQPLATTPHTTTPHTTAAAKIAATALTAALSFATLVTPASAQTTLDPATKTTTATAYLNIICPAYTATLRYNAAAIKADRAGMKEGAKIPKYLSKEMKQAAKARALAADQMLAYKWPNTELTSNIEKIAEGYDRQAEGLARVADKNKWQDPWRGLPTTNQYAKPVASALGDPQCIDPAAKAAAATAFLNVVCPLNTAIFGYNDAYNKAEKAGMKDGSKMPKYLVKPLKRMSDAFAVASDQLLAYQWPHSELTAKTTMLADDYQRISAFTNRSAKGTKWRTIDLRDIGSTSAFIRVVLDLPPAGEGCPTA
jgi:hypothetical protein